MAGSALRIKLQTPFREVTLPYVPASAAWNIPYKGEITIKMLLQHSAGVYDVDNDSVPGSNGKSYTAYMMTLDQNHQFTAEEMVGQATLHQLSYFVPGTDHYYSNTGFAILSEIAKRVYTFHSGSSKTFPITCTTRFTARKHQFLSTLIFLTWLPISICLHLFHAGMSSMKPAMLVSFAVSTSRPRLVKEMVTLPCTV